MPNGEKRMKKAFTIIELLVAMALLAMLIAISGIVFSTAVRAYRTAGATTEIAAKLQVITQQLNADFRGLRKEGEFLLVWAPSPELKIDGTILDENNDTIPDRYFSFDRLLFFTEGDFQSYHLQPPPSGTIRVSSNLARVCYSFGRDAKNVRAWNEPNPVKRMLCRTQHLFSGDMGLPTFPDLSVAWDATGFEQKNFACEYQTMTMEDWFNLMPIGGSPPIKEDMLTSMLDVTFSPSTVAPNCPQIDLTTSQKTASTVHQLFMQGVGQFRVQIWRSDLNRWFPEIDPDGNGSYNDSDYYVAGGKIYTDTVGGVWNTGNDASHFTIYYPAASGRPSLTIPFASAVKFTFTLYDSNGVFKDGKTFTHIVYLN